MIYPLEGKQPFYVEFNRGDKKNEFTLFQRQFMYSDEQLAEFERNSPKDIFILRMQNEVHPWNLFTSTYGNDGCVPDQKWICWFVDALNEKVKNDANRPHEQTMAMFAATDKYLKAH